jgi:CheY-like chemotaxis protein
MHLPPTRELSILVAEDEPANQKLLRLILEQYGHRVTLASDGFQAYALWEQGSYDLILMDIQMPGMQGDEVVKKIRQQEQQQHIPIIAVTANTFEQGRKSLLEAGCDGYVAKPFHFDDLLAEIETVV